LADHLPRAEAASEPAPASPGWTLLDFLKRSVPNPKTVEKLAAAIEAPAPDFTPNGPLAAPAVVIDAEYIA